MKKPHRLCWIIMVALLISSTGSAYAERRGKSTQEEQMQQMMDMIKGMSKGAGQGKGMDEKTQKQLENMFKGMGQQMDKRQAAQTKKEQQQFEATTVGHGTAIVEVEGKRYDLVVTKCELWGAGSRRFTIEARQPPAKGAWKLSMGAGKRTRVGLTFQAGRQGYWREQTGSPDKSSSLTIKNDGLQWKGLVGEREDIPATVQVTCGSEMNNYAQPANPQQKTSPYQLTLQLGAESHPFQIGYCSTKEYRTGNLMVEFDATASGTFRGRPAVVLLSKSHPVGGQSGRFEEMTLLLGKLTKEQRVRPPWKINHELDEVVSVFSKKAHQTIKEEYDREMAVIQEQYGKDIPPEKMSEAMDAMNKANDAYGKKMDTIQDQVKARRFPEARSHGKVTLNGKEGLFRGPKFRVLHGKNVAEFKNLQGSPEVRLNCGK